MLLLSRSPLPWTFTMLADWFGLSTKGGGTTIPQAVAFGRIWNCGRGCYTAINRKPKTGTPESVAYGPKVIVTDEMCARWANL